MRKSSQHSPERKPEANEGRVEAGGRQVQCEVRRSFGPWIRGSCEFDPRLYPHNVQGVHRCLGVDGFIDLIKVIERLQRRMGSVGWQWEDLPQPWQI